MTSLATRTDPQMTMQVRGESLAPIQTIPAASDAITQMLMRGASDPNFDVTKFQDLLQAKRDMEADEARRAFNRAFADFKAEAVKIIKGTEIKDGPLKGKKHANLFDVVSATTPALSKHGLTISWKPTKDEPTWIEVTCILRHVAGHSESVSMGGAPDAGPGRNAIQSRGSAKSYLERYTATAILGLAAQDGDDDGNGAAPEPVSDDMVREVEARFDEVGLTEADMPRFLAYLQVPNLAAMTMPLHAKAMIYLNQLARVGSKKK